MPITALHVVSAGGERKAPLSDTHRLTVRAYWSPAAGRAGRLVTAFDLLTDPLCPRLGDRLIDWAYDPVTDSYWHAGPAAGTGLPHPLGFPVAPPERPGATAVETAASTQQRVPRDPDAVLVGVSPRQEADDGSVWLLDLEYAGEKDPTAEAPEVEYDSVPYVVQKVQDVHGALVTNSALDPYADGMPVDESKARLVIVRNVPDGLWNPAWRGEYESTLNLLPYRHSVMVPDVSVGEGNPLTEDNPLAGGSPAAGGLVPAAPSPPGHVRLVSLRAVRLPRVRTPHAARRTWYWRMTAVMEIDDSTFIDNNGERQPVRHRAVLADAGLNERDDQWRLKRVTTCHGVATSPVPLDGRGRMVPLALSPNAPGAGSQLLEPPVVLASPVADDDDGTAPRPDHLMYACRVGQVLTVPAPGLLTNAARLTPFTFPLVTVGPLKGAVSQGVDADGLFDGSFSYTPTASTPAYTGWDYFKFQLSDPDNGDSNEAACAIHIGPTQKVRVFERYRHANWTAIAHLIGGW